MSYAFEFTNLDGSVDQFDLGSFEDDRTARRAASSALLVSTSAVRVEVWRRSERIAAISRSAAQNAA